MRGGTVVSIRRQKSARSSFGKPGPLASRPSGFMTPSSPQRDRAAAFGIECAGARCGREAGQAKSTPCIACHGIDGNSANPEWPSIAGQHESYIVRQLKAFRDGVRQNPLMSPMAAGLSDQDIADLAAWYSSQTARGGEAEPSKSAGQKVYRAGMPRTKPGQRGLPRPTGRGTRLQHPRPGPRDYVAPSCCYKTGSGPRPESDHEQHRGPPV